MHARYCCFTPLVVTFSFAVVLLAANGHIVAQSPGDARKQLGAAEQAELVKAGKLNKRAITLYGQGKYREATPVATQVLKIREQVLGPEHPDTATSLNDLADLYDKQGNFAAAEPLYLRALKIHEKNPQP